MENPRKIDWEGFKKELGDKMTRFDKTKRRTEDLEHGLDFLKGTIISSYENICQKSGSKRGSLVERSGVCGTNLGKRRRQ